MMEAVAAAGTGQKPRKQFQCQHCQEGFNLERNLSLHLASHQDSPFVCPECGRLFRRLASFKSHLNLHWVDDGLSCPKCDAVFEFEANLEAHFESVHESGAKSSASAKGRKGRGVGDLTCSECERKFKSRVDLQLHEREHRKIRRLLKTKRRRKGPGEPFAIDPKVSNVCKFCSKSFRKPSQCQRHERIHTGEKPFKCEHCDKSFNQKNSLEIHARRHLGVKPFTCDICKMKFAQKCNMHAHILRVHSGFCRKEEERLYRCPDCPCSFRKVGSLNAHAVRFHSAEVQGMEGHSTVVLSLREGGGKVREEHVVRSGEGKDSRYLCQHCPKAFRKPASLSKHLQRHDSRAQGPVHQDGRGKEEAQTDEKPSDLIPVLGKGEELSPIKEVTSVTEDGLIVIDPSDLGVDFSQLTFEPPSSATNLAQVGGAASSAHPPSDATLQGVLLGKEEDEEGGAGGESRPPPGIGINDDDGGDDDGDGDSEDYASYGQQHSGGESLDILRHGLGDDDSFFPEPHPASPPPPPPPPSAPVASTGASTARPPPSTSSSSAAEPISVSVSQRLYGELLTEKEEGSTAAGGGSERTADLPPPGHRGLNVCATCSKAFKKPSDLLRHIRIHTKEKPFQCPQCSKRFSLKSTLTFHLRTHEDPDSRHARSAALACHLCSLRFAKKSALKSHLRLHTGTCPYRCGAVGCRETFRTPALRRAHRDRFHGGDNATPSSSSAHHSSARPASTHPPSLMTSSQSSSSSMMHISVPAASLTSALSAVSDMGVPLVGSTLKLQLDFGPGGSTGGGGGGGGEGGSTVTHLKVDETLLRQLAVGGNVSLVIHPQQRSEEAEEANLGNLHLGQSQQQEQQEQPPVPKQQQQQQQEQDVQQQTRQKEPSAAEKSEEDAPTKSIFPKKKKEMPTDKIRIVSPVKQRGGEGGRGRGRGKEGFPLPTVSKVPPRKTPAEIPTVLVTGTSCPLCPKSFSRPSQLRRHLRVHTRERPFVCSDCGRCFSQKNSLRAHENAVHAGERPFKCPFCDLAVAQKSNLKTHIRRAHEEQAKRLVREVAGRQAGEGNRGGDVT